MTKSISANEARTKFGELMNSVYYNGNEVIVERWGRPMVKVVPFDKNKKSIKDLAGIWKGEDGKGIEKNAKKVRRKTKILSS